MDMPANPIETTIGQGIAVRVMAPPVADVIFLSTDAEGTSGQLNREVLRQLDLPLELPNAEMLLGGYSISRVNDKTLCYIVTVTNIPTARALADNLAKALTDPLFDSVQTLWVPLMGTGAGELPVSQSFSIILKQITADERVDSGQLTVVISLPEVIEPRQHHLILEEMGRFAPDGAASMPPLPPPPPPPGDASEGAGPPGAPLPAGPSSYDLPLSASVTAALEHASGIARLLKEPRDILSTTLLFFALADSQSDAAPPLLREDPSAEFFAAAVRYLAGQAYSVAWRGYFGTDDPAPRTDPGTPRRKPTRNVAQVLQAAARIAGAGAPIQMDHLVTALLTQPDTRLQRRLADMAIAPQRLLDEHRDARVGQVAKKFNNDVATSDDQLGYASYATAIHEFLTNAETLPPLSISIQAPWGGGKSSLMNLVREKLDPLDIREKHKALPASAAAAKRLLLGSVLKLLDQSEAFTVSPEKAPDANPSEKRLWTIWFNAWKYDTSEQVWAGLVDAIVSQVAERLPLIEREKFLLKLQLARIDDTLVRKRIYDRVITIWWAKVRALTLAGVASILALFGIGVVKPGLPQDIQIAMKGWSDFGLVGAVAAQVVLSVYLVASYFTSRDKVRKEPATFSLADYIRVPDYNKAVGEIHNIHADLMRVLKVVPRDSGGDEHAPLVIFIDDLDRCSPGKVASVVEGVSMLLASNSYRCMFVIGMDPQMVAAALQAAHDDVRKQLPRYERAVPLGWRFMDKFIQLPFTIPPTAGREFSGYVDWLLGAVPAPGPFPESDPIISDDMPHGPLPVEDRPDAAELSPADKPMKKGAAADRKSVV